MTTPKDIQTSVNEVYRSAIIAVLEEADGPLDNASMNDAILGGSTEAQIQGEPEPFAAALLQVVVAGHVLALQIPWTNDNGEESWKVVHKIARLGTDDEKAQSLVNVAENGPDGDFDADDPTTWPIVAPTLELLEEMNANRQAARTGLQEMIAGIAQEVMVSRRDDSDQTVH